MQKASGVYWTLNDNSLRVSGSTQLIGIVPMNLVKGRFGTLIRVTAEDFESLVGNDMAYNPNYAGLYKMLQAVSYLDILRVNKDASCANLFDDASGLSSAEGIGQDDDLSEVGETFAVRLTDAGNPGQRFVRVKEVLDEIELPVPSITSENYVFTLPFALGNKNHETYAGTPVVTILRDGADLPLAVVKSDGKVYAIVNGSIALNETGSVSGTTLTLQASAYSFTTTKMYYNAFNPETALYQLVLASLVKTTYKILATTDFSMATDSDIYYDKVDFGDLSLYVKEGATPAFDKLASYVELQNGSNGTAPSATSMDLSLFDTSPANVVVMNGLTTDVSVINAIAQKAHKTLKSFFIGAPDFTKYVSVSDWATSLYSTEYSQLTWISDNVKDEEIGTYQICPSVNLFLVYADMLNKYGTLNYPPAGPTYGNIAITKLTETDAALYKDELKTERINYQVVESQGAMIWEQTTRYANVSSLQRANTVFTLRDLRAQCLNWGKSFNFRLPTPKVLTVFVRGVVQIFQAMKDAGFLYSYTVVAPSWAEIQASGGVAKIRCQVAVTQAMEVIEFEVELTSE